MHKLKLMTFVLSAVISLDVFGAWSYSNSTLTWNDNGSEYWKLSVSVADKAITLTSMESTVTSDKSLDLTGALEAYGFDDSYTGYSLSFAEGEGLSVFSQVEKLTISGKWFTLMRSGAGASFTALTKAVLGTKGIDLQLGDTEAASVAKGASPVFSSADSLTDVYVFGQKIVLKATFITHRNLRNVSIRAMGELNIGYSVFWCGKDSSSLFPIQHAELISGGNLTINGSSLRTAIAKDAQIYIEAPSSATVTLAASTFQSESDHPFVLYWNAPCPNDAKNAFVGAEFDWYISNKPAIANTFPQMDGQNIKALGEYAAILLPSDTSDTVTKGRWEISYDNGTTVNSGLAQWKAGLPDEDIVEGTNGWSFCRSMGRLTQTDDSGAVRWDLAVDMDFNQVTIEPLTEEMPSDGVFSLAGADLSTPWSDVNLCFAEGTGVFAGVKELNLEGIPWLRQMNQRSATSFTAITSFKAGTPDADLTLGDNTETGSNTYLERSVFAAASSLTNVHICGRNVTLNNTFNAHPNISRVFVCAEEKLMVGVCSFYGAKSGGCIKFAEFSSMGDMTFAGRSLFRAIAKGAQIFVTSSLSSNVECGEWMFYDDDLNRSFDLYWNAPAPTVLENAMHHVDFTWYIYNDSESTKTFLDQSGVKMLGDFVSVSLPQDRFSFGSGTWRYGDGMAYAARWYGRRPGMVVSFR